MPLISRDPDVCDVAGCDHSCNSTSGSVVCICASGYQLQTDGRTCSDVNECIVNRGGCDHVCINDEGYFYCDCYNGYWLESDGYTCKSYQDYNPRPVPSYQYYPTAVQHQTK